MMPDAPLAQITPLVQGVIGIAVDVIGSRRRVDKHGCRNGMRTCSRSTSLDLQVVDPL